MSKYSNTIEYKLRTDVDLSGINKLHASLNKLQASFQKLSFNAGGTASAQLGFEKELRTIEQVQTAFRQSYNFKINSTDISKLSTSLKAANVDVKNLYTTFSRAGTIGVQSFNQMIGTIGRVNTAIKTTSSMADKMFNTFSNTLRWGVAAGIIEGMRQSISQAVEYVKDLDTSLNDIRIVSGQSAEQMRTFALEANKAAQSLGKTTTEFTKASLIFVQQGYDTAKANQLAGLTLKTANVTGQDTATVSEQLTALVNGYQLQGASIEYVEQQVDKLAKVAAVGAADLEELATGFSKVSAVASTLGVSVDQLTAQLSTIISVTREAPEAVGNSLKTIYSRLGDLKLGETLDDGMTLGMISKNMEKLGIDVLDATGNMRDMGTIIEDLMAKWKTLNAAQKQGAAVALAGRWQYTRFMALLENSEMYYDQLNESLKSAGTLEEQQSIYLDSAAAKLNSLKAAGEGIINTLFDPEDFKPTLDALTDIVNVFNQFLDALGGGAPVLSAFGAIMTRTFSSQVATGISNMYSNVMQRRMTRGMNTSSAAYDLINELGADPNLSQKSTSALLSAAKVNTKYASLMNKEEAEKANKSLEKWISKLNALEGELQESTEEMNKLNAVMSETFGRGDYIILENGMAKINEEVLAVVQSLDMSDKALEDLFKNTDMSRLSSSLLDVRTDMEKVVNGTDEFKNKIAEVWYNMERINAYEFDNAFTGDERVKINQLIQEIEALAASNMEESQKQDMLNGHMTEFIQILARANLRIRQYSGEIDVTADSVQGLTGVVNSNTEALKRANQQLGDTSALREREYATRQLATEILNVVSAMGMMASATMMLESLGDIIADDDISAGEKFLRIIENIGMVLPMVGFGFTSLVNAREVLAKATRDETTAENINSGATDKNTAAHGRNAKGQLAQAGATDTATGAMSRQSRVLGGLYGGFEKAGKGVVGLGSKLGNALLSAFTGPIGTIVMVGTLIAGVVSAINGFMEGQAEKDKERLEELKTEASELAAQLGNIQNARGAFRPLYEEFEKTGLVTQDLKEKLIDYGEVLGETIRQEDIRASTLSSINEQLDRETRIKANTVLSNNSSTFQNAFNTSDNSIYLTRSSFPGGNTGGATEYLIGATNTFGLSRKGAPELTAGGAITPNNYDSDKNWVDTIFGPIGGIKFSAGRGGSLSSLVDTLFKDQGKTLDEGAYSSTQEFYVKMEKNDFEHLGSLLAPLFGMTIEEALEQMETVDGQDYLVISREQMQRAVHGIDTGDSNSAFQYVLGTMIPQTSLVQAIPESDLFTYDYEQDLLVPNEGVEYTPLDIWIYYRDLGQSLLEEITNNADRYTQEQIEQVKSFVASITGNNSTLELLEDSAYEDFSALLSLASLETNESDFVDRIVNNAQFSSNIEPVLSRLVDNYESYILSQLSLAATSAGLNSNLVLMEYLKTSSEFDNDAFNKIMKSFGLNSSNSDDIIEAADLYFGMQSDSGMEKAYTEYLEQVDALTSEHDEDFLDERYRTISAFLSAYKNYYDKDTHSFQDYFEGVDEAEDAWLSEKFSRDIQELRVQTLRNADTTGQFDVEKATSTVAEEAQKIESLEWASDEEKEEMLRAWAETPWLNIDDAIAAYYNGLWDVYINANAATREALKGLWSGSAVLEGLSGYGGTHEANWGDVSKLIEDIVDGDTTLYNNMMSFLAGSKGTINYGSLYSTLHAGHSPSEVYSAWQSGEMLPFLDVTGTSYSTSRNWVNAQNAMQEIRSIVARSGGTEIDFDEVEDFIVSVAGNLDNYGEFLHNLVAAGVDFSTASTEDLRRLYFLNTTEAGSSFRRSDFEDLSDEMYELMLDSVIQQYADAISHGDVFDVQSASEYMTKAANKLADFTEGDVRLQQKILEQAGGDAQAAIRLVDQAIAEHLTAIQIAYADVSDTGKSFIIHLNDEITTWQSKMEEQQEEENITPKLAPGEAATLIQQYGLGVDFLEDHYTAEITRNELEQEIQDSIYGYAESVVDGFTRGMLVTDTGMSSVYQQVFQDAIDRGLSGEAAAQRAATASVGLRRTIINNDLGGAQDVVYGIASRGEMQAAVVQSFLSDYGKGRELTAEQFSAFTEVFKGDWKDIHAVNEAFDGFSVTLEHFGDASKDVVVGVETLRQNMLLYTDADTATQAVEAFSTVIKGLGLTAEQTSQLVSDLVSSGSFYALERANNLLNFFTENGMTNTAAAAVAVMSVDVSIDNEDELQSQAQAVYKEAEKVFSSVPPSLWPSLMAMVDFTIDPTSDKRIEEQAREYFEQNFGTEKVGELTEQYVALAQTDAALQAGGINVYGVDNFISLMTSLGATLTDVTTPAFWSLYDATASTEEMLSRAIITALHLDDAFTGLGSGTVNSLSALAQRRMTISLNNQQEREEYARRFGFDMEDPNFGQHYSTYVRNKMSAQLGRVSEAFRSGNFTLSQREEIASWAEANNLDFDDELTPLLESFDSATMSTDNFVKAITQVDTGLDNWSDVVKATAQAMTKAESSLTFLDSSIRGTLVSGISAYAQFLVDSGRYTTEQMDQATKYAGNQITELGHALGQLPPELQEQLMSAANVEGNGNWVEDIRSILAEGYSNKVLSAITPYLDFSLDGDEFKKRASELAGQFTELSSQITGVSDEVRNNMFAAIQRYASRLEAAGMTHEEAADIAFERIVGGTDAARELFGRQYGTDIAQNLINAGAGGQIGAVSNWLDRATGGNGALAARLSGYLLANDQGGIDADSAQLVVEMLKNEDLLAARTEEEIEALLSGISLYATPDEAALQLATNAVNRRNAQLSQSRSTLGYQDVPDLDTYQKIIEALIASEKAGELLVEADGTISGTALKAFEQFGSSADMWEFIGEGIGLDNISFEGLSNDIAQALVLAFAREEIGADVVSNIAASTGGLAEGSQSWVIQQLNAGKNPYEEIESMFGQGANFSIGARILSTSDVSTKEARLAARKLYEAYTEALADVAEEDREGIIEAAALTGLEGEAETIRKLNLAKDMSEHAADVMSRREQMEGSGLYNTGDLDTYLNYASQLGISVKEALSQWEEGSPLEDNLRRLEAQTYETSSAFETLSNSAQIALMGSAATLQTSYGYTQEEANSFTDRLAMGLYGSGMSQAEQEEVITTLTVNPESIPIAVDMLEDELADADKDVTMAVLGQIPSFISEAFGDDKVARQYAGEFLDNLTSALKSVPKDKWSEAISSLDLQHPDQWDEEIRSFLDSIEEEAKNTKIQIEVEAVSSAKSREDMYTDILGKYNSESVATQGGFTALEMADLISSYGEDVIDLFTQVGDVFQLNAAALDSIQAATEEEIRSVQVLMGLEQDVAEVRQQYADFYQQAQDEYVPPWMLTAVEKMTQINSEIERMSATDIIESGKVEQVIATLDALANKMSQLDSLEGYSGEAMLNGLKAIAGQASSMMDILEKAWKTGQISSSKYASSVTELYKRIQKINMGMEEYERLTSDAAEPNPFKDFIDEADAAVEAIKTLEEHYDGMVEIFGENDWIPDIDFSQWSQEAVDAFSAARAEFIKMMESSDEMGARMAASLQSFAPEVGSSVEEVKETLAMSEEELLARGINMTSLASGVFSTMSGEAQSKVSAMAQAVTGLISGIVGMIQSTSASFTGQVVSTGTESLAITATGGAAEGFEESFIHIPNFSYSLQGNASTAVPNGGGVTKGEVGKATADALRNNSRFTFDEDKFITTGQMWVTNNETGTSFALRQEALDPGTFNYYRNLYKVGDSATALAELSVENAPYLYGPGGRSGAGTVPPSYSGTGGGGGGGGGGGSSYEPKKQEYLEEELDLYEKINTLLTDTQKDLELISKEQDRLIGDKLAANIKKQIDLTQKQIKLEQEKLGIMEDEAKAVKERLINQTKEQSTIDINTGQEVKIGGLIGADNQELTPQFDDEGFLMNYADLFTAHLNRINSYIALYNQAQTEEAQNFIQLQIDLAKKAFEEFKDDYSRYDTLVSSEMNDLRNQIESDINAIEDKTIELYKTSIEAIDNIQKLIEKGIEVNAVFTGIDSSDPFRKSSVSLQKLNTYLDRTDLSAKEFWSTMIKGAEDAAKATEDAEEKEAALARANLYRQASQRSADFGDTGTGILDTDMAVLEILRAEVDKYEKTGKSDIFGENAKALYDEYQSWLEKVGDDFINFEKNIEELGSLVIDMVKETVRVSDTLSEHYDDLNSRLDHYSKVNQMIYGDTAYDTQIDITKAQIRNTRNKLKNDISTRDYLQGLLDNESEFITVERVGANGEKQEVTVRNPRWDEIYGQIVKKQEDIDKGVQENLEQLKKLRADRTSRALSATITNMGLSGVDANGNAYTPLMGDGYADLSYIQEQWELINRNADLYLDDVNRAAETQKLQNKYQQMLNDNIDPGLQRQITEQMRQQLEYLREKDKLSQYDVDYANAQLDILQKRIALEEAQRNKSQLKLKRDAQGNYSYVYIADQSGIDTAEDDLLNAEQDAYNLAKNQSIEMQGNSLAALQDYYNQVMALSERDDLTMEEKQHRLEFYTANLKEQLAAISEQLGISTTEALEQAQLIAESVLDGNQTATYLILENANAANEEMLSGIDERFNSTVTSWIEGMDSVGSSLDTLMADMTSIWESYGNTIADTGETIGENFDNIGESVAGVAEATSNLNHQQKIFQKILKEQSGLTQGYIDAVAQMQAKTNGYSDAIQKYKQLYNDAEKTILEMQAENAALLGEIDNIKNGGKGSSASGSKDGKDKTGGKDGKSSTDGSDSAVTENGTKWTNEDLIEGIAGNIWTYGSWANDPTRHEDLAARFGAQMAVLIQQFVNKGMSALAHDWTSGYYQQFGIDAFDTGGYTGEWDSSGKLAMLHQKELVLNKTDTENMLEAVRTLRDMQNAALMNNNLSTFVHSDFGNAMSTFNGEQDVHIEATFPGVQTAIEIQEALLGLANQASHYMWQNDKR